MKASDFLNYKNWVVVGDVLNSTKYAYKILKALQNEEFNVSGVNPRSDSEEAYKNLGDVPYNIEVIDLCINPRNGMEIIKEAKELNIDKVLIQPGAESDEILELCENEGITAIKGCVLVELRNRV